MPDYLHQDWRVVDVGSGRPATKPTKKFINSATSGYNTTTVKKDSNVNFMPNAKKIDEKTEADKVQYIDPKPFIKLRLEKKLSQKQMANLVNENETIIKELEKGKLVKSANQKLLNKLNRLK